MRGIVSLAAALAIPLTTATGEPFPDRDLILFLTFSVILVTLVGQGLMLPTVIRCAGPCQRGRREHRCRSRGGTQCARAERSRPRSRGSMSSAVERESAGDMLGRFMPRHRDRLKHVEHRSDGDDSHRKLIELHDEIEFELIDAERKQINDLYRGGKLKDEARRRIERELDLREAHLVNVRGDGD